MLGFEKDLSDFEIFMEKATKAVSSRCGEGCEVIVRPITKLNGVVWHGMSIKGEGKRVVPTVYLEDFFEEYNRGMTLSTVTDRIYEILLSGNDVEDVNVDFFSDYKQVKNRLGIKLVNAAANSELLKDVPHKRFLDLAIVCYVAVRDQTIGSGSILVHNNHIMMWGISEREVIFDAIENVSRIEPGKLIKITDMLKEMLDDNSDTDSIMEDMINERQCSLFVLTNESRSFGASVLIYKGMLESIARSIESDYYVIPSSIHEVLVIPADNVTDYETLNRMVQEVNNTQLTPMEILSDHVYLYSRDRATLVECVS